MAAPKTPNLCRRVVHVPETGSTMDDVKALAVTGEPEGAVVWADRQAAGRGRDGRTWASPPGGAWFTVLLRPRAPPAAWGLLPLAGGNAVAAVLRARGIAAGVKWPNDVLVDARKVAGVLCESRFPPHGFVLVGFGVNVDVDPADLPADVRGVAGTLRDHGGPHDGARLVPDVLDALAERYAWLEAGDTERLLDEHRALSVTLGERVSLRSGERGIARDVRADGALLVDAEDGARLVVPVGDVHVL